MQVHFLTIGYLISLVPYTLQKCYCFLADLEESGSEDEAKVSPKKAKKSKKIVATKTKTFEKVENNTDKKELPFTFKVPKTSDDLEELFEGRNSMEKAIIIERMIKCNHPQFGKDNKAQLENLFAFLLQHIHDSASIGKFPKGTSINDVSSNSGFLDPPPSPCRLSFSPKNRLKMPFLTPPSLPLKGDVVYGWSLSENR